MDANYLFIDGSALGAQVRKLWKIRPKYNNRKLCVLSFVQYLMETLTILHNGSYKRAVFYFPVGDEVKVREFFRMPNLKKSGEVRDIHFKYCGWKIKKSAKFDKWAEENVPEEFKDRFSKSEKGIDIEICCDALKLASMGRLDRLFILTNDSDMVPMCRTLKDFGANISMIQLSEALNPNIELLKEVDTYDTITDDNLDLMFYPLPGENEVLVEEPADNAALPEADKPDAEPSDLNLNDIGEDEDE